MMLVMYSIFYLLTWNPTKMGKKKTWMMGGKWFNFFDEKNGPEEIQRMKDC